MFAYGAAPAVDVVEVTIFGPGYGEAIAVHIGDGQWVLVDSCKPLRGFQPASIDYLNRIGVPLDRVVSVIITHWHDDHSKGFSEIVAACPAADVWMSDVLNSAEMKEFATAFGSEINGPLASGTREIFRTMRASVGRRQYASHRSQILGRQLSNHRVDIVAFSPTTEAKERSISYFSKFLPIKTSGKSSPINNAPDPKPNISSVVLHFSVGNSALLLGSDMENAAAGWQAIVDNAWCLGLPRAEVYKVAHHGGISGDHDSIWGMLLGGDCVGVLTPWTKGGHRLPDQEDHARLRARVDSVFVTSVASRKAQIPPEKLKRVETIAANIELVNAGFGAVRSRKALLGGAWAHELFGNAGRL